MRAKGIKRAGKRSRWIQRRTWVHCARRLPPPLPQHPGLGPCTLTPPPPSAVRSGPPDCDLPFPRQPRTGCARSSHVLTPQTPNLQPIHLQALTLCACTINQGSASSHSLTLFSTPCTLPPYLQLLLLAFACAGSRDVLFQIRAAAHPACCSAGVSQRASASCVAVECTGCVCTAWRRCGGSGAIFEMDQ